MKDLTIKCQSCKQEFVWTTGEQQFYQSKGLPEPIFCIICRAKKAAESRDPAKRNQST